MADIPDPTFDGRPLSDNPPLELHSWSVFEWCPTPDGSGPPEEMHLVFELAGALDGARLAFRIKSRRAADQMVAILERHRDSVWPEK